MLFMELCGKKQQVSNFKFDGMTVAVSAVAVFFLSWIFCGIVGATDLHGARKLHSPNIKTSVSLATTAHMETAKQHPETNYKHQFMAIFSFALLIFMVASLTLGIIFDLRKIHPAAPHVLLGICCLLPLMFFLNKIYFPFLF